jgi:hypothetical protein
MHQFNFVLANIRIEDAVHLSGEEHHTRIPVSRLEFPEHALVVGFVVFVLIISIGAVQRAIYGALAVW